MYLKRIWPGRGYYSGRYGRARRRQQARYLEEQILIRKRRQKGIFRAGVAGAAPAGIGTSNMGIGLGSRVSEQWMIERTGQNYGTPIEGAIIGTAEALWRWISGMWQVIEIFR